MANETTNNGAAVTLSETQGSALSFSTVDIKGMTLTTNGGLVINLANGTSTTIENFRALAQNDVKLTLGDGQVINSKQLFDTLAHNMPAVDITHPAPGTTVSYELQAGQKYNIDFEISKGDRVEQKDGAMIITFADNGVIVLENFAEASTSSMQPEVFYKGGQYTSLEEFFASLRMADSLVEDGTRKVVQSEAEVKVSGEQEMAALAEQLAGVEPAAGGAGGGRAGGFGFQSTVDAAPMGSPDPLGPIGPTALAFGLPGPQEPLMFVPDERNPEIDPPSVLANLGVDNAIVKEDGSIFVPITASLASTNPAGTILTVTVTGLDNSWNITNVDGAYDPAAGTWTITMPAGVTSYSGGLTFAPPHDSDADMSGLNAHAQAFDPASGLFGNANDAFNILTDAVADKPTITASDNAGAENTAIAVNITAAVTDTDGSETITGYEIHGVPGGFTFNHGTNLGGGVWSFTPAEIVGLTVSAPAKFFGTVNMSAKVLNEETNLSGGEVDFNDNKNNNSDEFVIQWKPVVEPPDVLVNNGVDDAQVKEDGSVNVPIVATLGA
ncbi:MAG TPA: hypothetical protein VIG74_03205, partial [Alphaproteobacteria bacterium]